MDIVAVVTVVCLQLVFAQAAAVQGGRVENMLIAPYGSVYAPLHRRWVRSNIQWICKYVGGSSRCRQLISAGDFLLAARVCRNRMLSRGRFAGGAFFLFFDAGFAPMSAEVSLDFVDDMADAARGTSLQL